MERGLVPVPQQERDLGLRDARVGEQALRAVAADRGEHRSERLVLLGEARASERVPTPSARATDSAVGVPSDRRRSRVSRTFSTQPSAPSSGAERSRMPRK